MHYFMLNKKNRLVKFNKAKPAYIYLTPSQTVQSLPLKNLTPSPSPNERGEIGACGRLFNEMPSGWLENIKCTINGGVKYNTKTRKYFTLQRAEIWPLQTKKARLNSRAFLLFISWLLFVVPIAGVAHVLAVTRVRVGKSVAAAGAVIVGIVAVALHMALVALVVAGMLVTTARRWFVPVTVRIGYAITIKLLIGNAALVAMLLVFVTEAPVIVLRVMVPIFSVRIVAIAESIEKMLYSLAAFVYKFAYALAHIPEKAAVVVCSFIGVVAVQHSSVVVICSRLTSAGPLVLAVWVIPVIGVVCPIMAIVVSVAVAALVAAAHVLLVACLAVWVAIAGVVLALPVAVGMKTVYIRLIDFVKILIPISVSHKGCCFFQLKNNSGLKTYLPDLRP